MKPYLRFVSLLLTAITFSITAVAQKTKPAKKPAAATPAVPASTFKNGIKLKVKGFKVSEASLYFDDESAVPQNNKIEVNQRVNMRLIIESGWSEIDGKVFPGGSEVIKLNTGAVILESEDLFKAYDETGVSPDDARYITLKAIITAMNDKRKYVIVTFRVWDKKSTAEITGSYKLFIK
jgi:hypothetical protein